MKKIDKLRQLIDELEKAELYALEARGKWEVEPTPQRAKELRKKVNERDSLAIKVGRLTCYLWGVKAIQLD